MKLFQSAIRILIFIGSAVGFFGGWALFAHSNKPVAAEVSAPSVAPLPSLSPLNFDAPTSLQPIQPIAPMPRTQMTPPRLRTRGS
jgi:hypothetical protein